MDIKMLALYFVIGGTIVATVTYFGSQSKGMLAAFIAFLPSISLITIITTYLAKGTEAATSYTRGMLLLLPSWVLYAVSVIFLLPRIGLVGSLVVSVIVYLATAFVIIRLT